MHSERDTTRVVRAWLRTDEHESAERVLEDVLALLDTNTQRLPLWPARRIAELNNAVKLAMAAAAVVVVAVAGTNLLAAPAGVGGGPTGSASPSTIETLRPIPSPAIFPPTGELAIGRHELTVEGVPLSITLPTQGWSSRGLNASRTGGSIAKGTPGTPDGVVISFWSPDGVYSDPCVHGRADPVARRPPTTGFAKLARAVATVPGIDLVAEPSFTFVDGLPGMYVVVTVRDDIGCDPQQHYLWYDEVDGPRSATALGSTIRAWDVDTDYLTFGGYDGVRVWFEAQTFRGASAEIEREIQQIVDSIRFACPTPDDVAMCR
jgi:hypothetical protein